MGFRENFAAIDTAIFSALGDTVTWTPAGGAAVSVLAFFENQYYESNAGGYAEAVGTRPMVTFKTVDVPNIARGDAVAFGGVNYALKTLEPTSDGLTLCELYKT